MRNLLTGTTKLGSTRLWASDGVLKYAPWKAGSILAFFMTVNRSERAETDFS